MSSIALAKAAAICLQILILAFIANFALRLTKKVDKQGRGTAIAVKAIFVLIAAAPLVWIYLYGAQYIRP